MKGFTGSRSCGGKTAHTKSKTSSAASAQTSSGSSDGYLFMSLQLFPTRVDDCSLLYTWHSNSDPDFRSIVSVRLYLTTTNPAYIDLNSDWQIGDSNPFSDSMTPDYNYNITSSAKDGELNRTWVEPGYYAIFSIQYKRYDEYDGWCSYWYTTSKSTSNIYSDAPSLSYNESSSTFSIGTSMTGRRVLEFYSTDNRVGYPTSISSEETLNEMYYASCVDMEWSGKPYKGYYYLSGAELNRWAPGRYTVGVKFNTSTNKNRISNAIDNALDEINDVLNDYGVYFTRSGTSGDISVIVDTEENLYDIDPFEEGVYVYGGTWETDVDSDGYIYGATVRLANNYYDGVPYMPYEGVALEELAQSMGAGYDQNEYPFDTLHTDFNYHNKPEYLTTKDRNILKLVYSDAVDAGYDYTSVARSLNLPKGCYIPTTSTTDTTRTVLASNFLERGKNYKVRVFIVNSSGRVSETSSWINVYVPEKVRPANFSWTYSKTKGGTFNLTASEWNSFTSRINDFRDYYDLSAYGFTTAYSGNTFTAAMYRQARTAIQAIDGYGTYIPYVYSGDVITADMMNTLVSELNSIP